MLGLPFEEEAKARGYTLQHYGATREFACYINKDGIYLEVWSDNKARLSFIKDLIIASLDFSLPHRNLDLFERRITAWKDAVDGIPKA